MCPALSFKASIIIRCLDKSIEYIQLFFAMKSGCLFLFFELLLLMVCVNNFLRTGRNLIGLNKCAGPL